jgi:hypothetical protein
METIPAPFPEFQENLGIHQVSDLETYLGEDMDGIWAEFFTSQRSTGPIWNGTALMGSGCD